MGRFSRALRRAERRLEGPEPERSEALVEMAGDLEDLYRAFRERGLGEEEARRRAVRWLAPSAEALDALGAVHVPGVERFLRRLGGSTRGRLELAALTAASLLAAAVGVYAGLRTGVLRAPSPSLWLVAGLAGLGAGTSLARTYVLFVRGDRLRSGWRRRVDSVLAAAAATGLTGLVTGGFRVTAAAPEGEGAAGAVPWPAVVEGAGLSSLGLSAGLLLALVWLILRLRARSVRRARSKLREILATLGEDEASPPDVGPDSVERETSLRLEETP